MGNDNQIPGRKKFYSANGPFFSANRSAKKKKTYFCKCMETFRRQEYLLYAALTLTLLTLFGFYCFHTGMQPPDFGAPPPPPGRVRPRRAAHAGRSAHARRPPSGKTRNDAPAARSLDHCRQPRRQGFLPCPPQRTARQGAGSRTQGPGTGPAERGNAPVQNRPQDRPGLPRRHPLCRKHERIPQNPSGRPRRAPYRPLQPQAPLRAA